MAKNKIRVNFCPEEQKLLWKLVSKYRDILTNKKTTSEINKKKEMTWKLLADEFNRIRQETSKEAIIRTPQQLQNRLKNASKSSAKQINVSEMGKTDEPLNRFFLQPIETSSLAASHSSSIHSTPQISFIQHESEEASPDQIEEDETSETEEKFILQPIETFSPASSCSTHITPQTSSKRSHCEDSNQVLKKVAKHMDQQMAEVPVGKEKFATFCEYVSEKLCSMPQEMVPICQKLISDVLFYGETQKLGFSAHVVME
ncbi:hypothetical protein JTE90_001797 [Oedothorax gibbosus]|uniref:Regulatory protein zeste n=1 Tax=Oedothorax gibbosus TaxID=931172 RepID=A0AAV6VSC4_9ARAC|nr:hypothetical protein JTE90_001797 [Oedothorax gibbosus]